jgi:hypothetical protein
MSDHRFTNRQQTAKQAMDVQDACNVRGVLKTFWDVSCSIEGGNPAINAAPEMVLFASKIASLIGCAGPDMEEFSKAWAACEELAKEPAQAGNG